jgi:hypothetical protein
MATGQSAPGDIIGSSACLHGVLDLVHPAPRRPTFRTSPGGGWRESDVELHLDLVPQLQRAEERRVRLDAPT